MCEICGQEHLTPQGAPSCKGHVWRCQDCNAAVNKQEPAVCQECGSTTVEKNMPCTHPKMRGQEVCWNHGGAAPQNRQAGIERHELSIAEERAKKAVARLGEPAQLDDPWGELERIAADSVQWYDYCHGRVIQLNGDLGYRSKKGIEQIRAEVQLYERAEDRASKRILEYAKLNIAERKQRVNEAQVATTIQGWVDTDTWRTQQLKQRIPPEYHATLDEVGREGVERLKRRLRGDTTNP